MWVCAGCLAVTSAAESGPVDLLAKVPADVMMVVSWKGMGPQNRGYGGSKLEAMLEATGMGERLQRAVMASFEEEAAHDETVQTLMACWQEMAPVLWRRPWLYYYQGLVLDQDAPEGVLPKYGFMIDPGDDVEVIVEWVNRLREFVQEEDPQWNPTVVDDGHLVGFFVNSALAEEPADGLVGTPRITPFLDPLSVDMSVGVWVDFKALRGMFDVVPSDGPEGTESFDLVFEVFGFNQLDQLVWAGGFKQSDWEQRLSILAPAPRSGLLRLMDLGALADDQLVMVPKSATWLRALRLDLDEAWDVMIDTFGQVDADLQVQLQKEIDQAGAMLGFDLRKDLVGSLGSGWTLYADPSFGGMFGTGMVLVNEPTDAAAVGQVLGVLEQMLNKQVEDRGLGFKFTTSQKDGLELHAMMLPFVSPAWAVSEGKLYMGLTPQAVTRAKWFADHPENTIVTDERFVAARAAIEHEGAVSGLMYTDVTRSAKSLYSGWSMLANLAAMNAQDMPFNPAELLPSLATLTPHLGIASGASWSDEEGYHGKSVSPFPGSMLLSQEIVFGNNVVMTNGIVSGVMGSVMANGRPIAHEVQEMSNLRQLGLSCHMYAADHDGRFPDRWRDVLTYVIGPGVFFVREDPNHLASREKQGDVLGQWIDSHGSFVLVRPGQKVSEIANMGEAILAVERPAIRLADELMVLFVDGHVEMVPDPQAVDELVKNQTGKTIEQWGAK